MGFYDSFYVRRKRVISDVTVSSVTPPSNLTVKACVGLASRAIMFEQELLDREWKF